MKFMRASRELSIHRVPICLYTIVSIRPLVKRTGSGIVFYGEGCPPVWASEKSNNIRGAVGLKKGEVVNFGAMLLDALSVSPYRMGEV